MQFTKCSVHTVIDVVLWFYILFMIFSVSFIYIVLLCSERKITLNDK